MFWAGYFMTKQTKCKIISYLFIIMKIIKSKTEREKIEAGNSSNTLEDYSEDNENTYRYTGYVIWGIAGLCFIGLLCLWSNIRLAIAIIKV